MAPLTPEKAKERERERQLRDHINSLYKIAAYGGRGDTYVSPIHYTNLYAVTWSIEGIIAMQ